jgi:hypothetical protein
MTQTPSLPGLTRQSINLRKTFCETGWMRGSSPRMTSYGFGYYTPLSVRRGR